jgi:hypothetical protein
MANYWLMMIFAITFASKQGFWHYFSTISFLACILLAFGLSLGATKKLVYGLLVEGVFLINYSSGETHFL